MFRRPRPHPRQALRRANHLKDSGQYVEAAEIFAALAAGAEERGFVRRAPHLYLQAAHCRLLAGQPERGISLLDQGLILMEQGRQWYALRQTGEVFVAELRRLGQADNAGKIQARLDKILHNHPDSAMPAIPLGQPASPTAPRLPEKCPYCGATLRADLLEWTDPHTAECMYCGSAVQAET